MSRALGYQQLLDQSGASRMVLDEASLPGLPTAALSLCPPMAFSPYVHVERGILAVSSSSYMERVLWDQGPTLMISLNFNYLFKKNCSPNIVPLGGRAST